MTIPLNLYTLEKVHGLDFLATPILYVQEHLGQ